MNDDPGSSSAARLLPDISDADYDIAAYGGPSAGSSDGHSHDDAPAMLPSRPEEKRRAGLVKKLELISHLQKGLDMMVFVYICTLYYMECSFVRFLLRIVPHYSFLTPKDGLLLPAEHPHIYTIFIPTVICMLAHIFFSLPQAGEATRGYLHGGVIIDFVGQKPPTTKLAFLFFDLVILGLQCLMLAVHQEREKLKKAVSPHLRTFSPSGDTVEPAVAAATTQDHDAEERGVLRDDTYIEDGEGTGLRPLSGENGGEEGSSSSPTDGERTGDTYSSAATSVDMVDLLMSGNAVLSNLHVIHAVRSVGSGAQNAAAYSLRTLGYNATLAALAAERRSRLIREQQR